MPQIGLSFRNEVMQKVQKALSEFGDRDARRILNMALNKVGRKDFVAVKRDLNKVTGIAYNQIEQSVHAQKSTPQTLTYSVKAWPQSTNLRQFKPRQTASSFSAAPWNIRRQFARTFQPNADPSRPVFHRIGVKEPGIKQAIKPSFGPDVAKEMLRPGVASGWSIIAADVLPEITRLAKLKLSGIGPFGARIEE